MRNECVQFSSSCGPPLTQISGIDLLVGVFEQEDYPDYKMSDLKIEVEKFMVSTHAILNLTAPHSWIMINMTAARIMIVNVL